MTGTEAAALDQRLASGWVVDTDAGGTAMRHPAGFSSTTDFYGPEGQRLFAVMHQPQNAPSLGVVVCPPVLAEAVRNQRRELVLGWELSAAGMAAVRFHYRGSGHSHGEPTSLAFPEMVADAVTAARALQQLSGVTEVAFVGTRLGAMVAAAAAREFPGGPVVLWEPPTDLRRYYNLVFRARIIGLFKRGEGGLATQKAMMEELERTGVVDVAGNPLAYSLYRSTIDLDLRTLVSDAGRRPVLIIQFSVKSDLRPGLVDVIESFAEAGQPVGSAVVPHDEAWWFGATGKTIVQTSSDALEAILLTRDFLEAGQS